MLTTAQLPCKYHAAGCFPKARKKHARAVKKILKVIYNRGESAPDPNWEVSEIPVAGTIKEACAQARDEERAAQAAYKTALGLAYKLYPGISVLVKQNILLLMMEKVFNNETQQSNANRRWWLVVLCIVFTGNFALQVGP